MPEVATVFLSSKRPSTHQWIDGQRAAFAQNGQFEVPRLAAGSWSIAAHGIPADRTTCSRFATLEVPAEGAIELALEPRR